MAKEEHPAKLREGAASWNEWRNVTREQDPDLRPDLCGAELSGILLVGADLSQVMLCEANLSHACLIHAHLIGPNPTLRPAQP